jgi:HlyD family secretion protein
MRHPLFPKFLAVLAIVLLLLLLLGYGGWSWYRSRQSAFSLPGEVQAQEMRNGSRLGGRVLKVWVREGQTVKAGQPLVDFDDADLRAKIAAAQADLKQARLQERQLARGADIDAIRQANAAVSQAREQVKLVDKGVRPEEAAQVKSRYESAQAQAKQAKDAAESARTLLDNGIISQQKFDSLQQIAEAAKASADSARAALSMTHAGGRSEDRQIARDRLNAAQAQAAQIAKGAGPDQVGIASANVDKAKSALQALQAQVGEVHVKAPFAGYVSVIGVSSGELVAPGRPVVSLIDYAHLWTEVFVPESKLLKMALSPGQELEVSAHADKTRTFPAKVLLVNPKSEFTPGGEGNTDEATFRVKVEIENTQANGRQLLYPGMKVDVHFR